MTSFLQSEKRNAKCLVVAKEGDKLETSSKMYMFLFNGGRKLDKYRDYIEK